MRKRILSYGIDATLANTWLLILRLSAGGFMLTHGYPKLLRLFDSGEIKFGDPIGIGPVASLVLTVFAEFFCSILVGLGLFTRLATVPLIITMLVAAFIAHGEDPFSRKELALMYVLVYVTLLVFGGGKYTVDNLIRGKKGI